VTLPVRREDLTTRHQATELVRTPISSREPGCRKVRSNRNSTLVTPARLSSEPRSLRGIRRPRLAVGRGPLCQPADRVGTTNPAPSPPRPTAVLLADVGPQIGRADVPERAAKTANRSSRTSNEGRMMTATRAPDIGVEASMASHRASRKIWPCQYHCHGVEPVVRGRGANTATDTAPPRPRPPA
jgi:hypothetical protein